MYPLKLLPPTPVQISIQHHKPRPDTPPPPVHSHTCALFPSEVCPGLQHGSVTPHPLSPLHPLVLQALGPDDGWVVCGVWQSGVLAVVEEAVAPTAVADEEEGSQEDQGTDGAGLPLQQEAEQVEAHEHGVVEPQRWVQRLGDEEHGEEPL